MIRLEVFYSFTVLHWGFTHQLQGVNFKLLNIPTLCDHSLRFYHNIGIASNFSLHVFILLRKRRFFAFPDSSISFMFLYWALSRTCPHRTPLTSVTPSWSDRLEHRMGHRAHLSRPFARIRPLTWDGWDPSAEIIKNNAGGGWQEATKPLNKLIFAPSHLGLGR